MLDGREGEGEIRHPVSDHNPADTLVCVLKPCLDRLPTAWVKGQYPWWTALESQLLQLPGQGFTAQGNFLRRGVGH